MMAQIVDIIKYEGDNHTFVWKHPREDFNTLSQLIVHESQEALFMMNGQALDLFGPGRYTLSTQNIPLIGSAIKLATDGKSPFHCEVYFINKVEQMAIKWGTDSKVQFVEPTYGFPLSIGASGEMSLRVENSRKFLLKLVGTENALTREGLVQYFRAFLMTKVKTCLAQTIKAQKINIFEIDERLEDLSGALHKDLREDFDEYGVELERFFVSNIAKPDGEAQYEKFKSLHFRQYSDIMEAKLRQQVSVIDAQTEAQKTVIESQAIAQKRAQEGYTYQQERGFDVAEQVAQNEAVGQFTNLGVGLGTMAGVGGTVAGVVGGTMNEAMQNAIRQEAATCAKCGATLPQNAKFCPTCGEKAQAPAQATVVCPQCGQTVIKAKFCPECGFKFPTNCPKCGADVGNAKFCPECGEKL
jgi:membrane protease subunit (stomatin/prohibitin family)